MRLGLLGKRRKHNTTFKIVNQSLAKICFKQICVQIYWYKFVALTNLVCQAINKSLCKKDLKQIVFIFKYRNHVLNEKSNKPVLGKIVALTTIAWHVKL